MADAAFHLQQANTAKWMGYPDAHAMNADHDPLHQALCRWLGIESQALRDARGEPLDRWERHLASLEEEAVLHLQRFMRHAGARVPVEPGL